MRNSRLRDTKASQTTDSPDLEKIESPNVEGEDYFGQNSAALLAVDGGLLKVRPTALPSPALELQSWLEADLGAQRSEERLQNSAQKRTERWPLRYGVLIALSFSILAWLAILMLASELLT
jgi:hypothetical protein